MESSYNPVGVPKKKDCRGDFQHPISHSSCYQHVLPICQELNDIPSLVRSANKITAKLHVIMVISNPCGYRRRIQLAREFICRMEEYNEVILYIVELAYPSNPQYELTEGGNPRHLRLLTSTPLWHKENMINVGVRKLLPEDWEYMAWIDADIQFDDPRWAKNTLKVLQKYDVAQLFSTAMDLDRDENAMRVYQGLAYQYRQGFKRDNTVHYWHPGYAWAITRAAYDKMGGLYEFSILGSGDDNMAKTWLGEKSWYTSLRRGCSVGYISTLRVFADRCRGIKLAYVPGNIQHYFHGSKANRKYVERWDYILQHGFDPDVHLSSDRDGVIIPTDLFPVGLRNDILNYFRERNEDE